ncbi:MULTISPECIES: hypothetical protein [unclassified Rickettsia]
MATATPRLRHEGFLLISDPRNNAELGMIYCCFYRAMQQRRRHCYAGMT